MTRLGWVGTPILLLFALSPLAIQAQEVRARIGGRVIDPQGGVVAGAAVDVVDEDTGVSQKTKTNTQGVWTVEFLLPGHYVLTISSPGFKTETRRGITLQAADDKTFDAALQIGEVTQSVEVNAETPLIDTTSATSGTVITRDQIMEMPSSSHVVTLLAVMSPGVIAQDQNNTLRICGPTTRLRNLPPMAAATISSRIPFNSTACRI